MFDFLFGMFLCFAVNFYFLLLKYSENEGEKALSSFNKSETIPHTGETNNLLLIPFFRRGRRQRLASDMKSSRGLGPVTIRHPSRTGK